MRNLIKLDTDFNDYYDDCFNAIISNSISLNYEMVYVRRFDQCMPKGRALNWLVGNHTKTIEFKPVMQFDPTDSRLVVYTDQMKHGGKGKVLCSYDSAIENYSNCLASRYVPTKDNCIIKMLQVGTRYYRLVIRINEKNPLEIGEVIDVAYIGRQLNMLIKCPIFSIDYIQNSESGELEAIDYNQVQSLSELEFDKILSKAEVFNEVHKAIKAYNF